MSLIWRQSIVYSAGAALAFATDVAVLSLLVETFGLHYLMAATISFVAGTMVVYATSVRYAFDFRRMTDSRKEFLVFTLIGAIGIGVNLGLMFTLVEWFGLHYLAAKVCAGAVTFLANFLARRGLLFTEWRAQSASLEPKEDAH
jgi:putative flippase GtrA